MIDLDGLRSKLNSAAGQVCTGLRYGPGQSLWLGFGPHVPIRTWEFQSIKKNWRILRKGEPAIGAKTPEPLIDSAFQVLRGQSLERVEISKENSDARLHLSGDVVVEFFEFSPSESNYRYWGPDGSITIGPGPIWAEQWGRELEQEWFLSHPLACTKRWLPLLPEAKGQGSCRHCAYYQHLKGPSYFWDFGICIHPESPRDGVVTFLEWGCVRFSDFLPRDDRDLMQRLSPMIGQRCSDVTYGLGQYLWLGLGPLIEADHPLLKKTYNGTYEVRSDLGGWRILQHGELLVGESDTGSDIEAAFHGFIGKTLERIELPGKNSDARFFFSQGVVIEFFEMDLTESVWSFKDPEGWMDIRPGPVKTEIEVSATSLQFYPEFDEVGRAQARAAKRWIENLEISKGDKNCQSCTFFFEIRGEGAKGLGLCTHDKSPRDGQVTAFTSGCSHYRLGQPNY